MNRILMVLSYLRPYRRACLLALCCIVADVLAALLVPAITAEMINHAVGGGKIEDIVWLGAQMLAVSIVSGGFALWGSWLSARISARFGRDLRQAVYARTLSFSAADFERFGTASMMTRTMNDVTVIRQSLMSFMQMVVPVPFMCILGIVFSFRVHAALGWTVFGATAAVLACALLIVRHAAPIFEKLQSFLDRMNAVLRECLTGVRVIRAFCKEDREKGRMRKSFEDYAYASIRANRLFAGLDCLATFAINICIVAVLYLGCRNVARGEMAIGGIAAAVEYAIWILFYIVMAQMVIMLMPRALACIRRVGDVLALAPEIQDPPGNRGEKANDPSGAVRAQADCLNRKSAACRSEVCPTAEHNAAGLPQTVLSFCDVGFKFADAAEQMLAGLNFTCRRGETTAVIGGTGSGKSTIAKLILRLHDVTSGKIKLFDRDIRDISQAELRSHIAYAPQKTWLFSGTVADNLRFGAPDASQDDMRRALTVAQSQFVFDLPDGLEARVAQGGTNFSGGQRQRLAIARALIKKADIYIFDDSFSALDFKTDAALRRAIAENMHDAAVLIIAQRISTIVRADNILVINDGRIVAAGKHKDLLASCKLYREIAESQTKGGQTHAGY